MHNTMLFSSCMIGYTTQSMHSIIHPFADGGSIPGVGGTQYLGEYYLMFSTP
jgi:hypothetical protein